VIVVTVTLTGEDAEAAREEIGQALEDFRDSMDQTFEFDIEVTHTNEAS
jgi:hypothetical protein